VEWKGKKLEKTTEIIDFGLSLKGKEQDEFVTAVANQGPYALQNIGYFSGYYSKEKAKEICQVFKTAHPIFGNRDVTSKEAFEMGVKMGEQIRERRENT